MEIKREMNIKLHGTETSAGYETNRSFGKVFNPWIILSQIKDTCDKCDGSENKESKLIAGNNTTETDSGNDSALYDSCSGHSSYDSKSKSKSASSSSDSGSSSMLSGSSSSSASTASSISEAKHVSLNSPRLTVEEHREFVMKVKHLQLLTLTAVKTKFKSKYVMLYIISNTEHHATDDKVRLYDKVLAVNGKQLSEHGFDIEELVNFTDSTDGVVNINLQIRRWVPVATQPGRYHIKDITVEYTISSRPGLRNPKLSSAPQSSGKRKIKDLRWVGRPRKVVLRMDEYTGLFVFVDDDNDLRIGTIPRGDKYYYHFLVRPFTCIVKNPNKDWISQGGVTFTYHHNNIYLDITSDLENGERELGVKDHRPFNIEKPDERFFLKHKNDGIDPDSQRYESLLYQDMCFKFDKESKTFMLKRFRTTNPSVGEYFFETYSISVIENEENVPLEIPCEDITTSPPRPNLNPRTLLQTTHRRKKKSLFGTFGNLFCCSVRQDLAEVGDQYVKEDSDDVLKYFKPLKDVPESPTRRIETILEE